MSTFLTCILDTSEIAQVSGGYVDWETNWCGTRVPGWPRPKSVVTLTNPLDAVALNPQPLPPREMDLAMSFSF
jgi:hypothetical protein